MISPQERKDKLVRATDLDALSCRFSANNRGYFNTPPDQYIRALITSYQKHLPFCQGYTQLLSNRTLRSVFQDNQKLPLINRGTYFRTRSIDLVVNDFILQHNGQCQIISIGSGSDTRAFRTLKDSPDVIYHEIDFPESCKIKRAAILEDDTLRDIIGYKEDSTLTDSITSKEDFQSYPSDLNTDRYYLYGVDLRELEGSKFSFDLTLPTLVISECVLCYISLENNARILSFFRDLFKSSTIAFLIYEPMSLNDSFGSTMTANLSGRGIVLPTFEKLPDLKTRLLFLKECKFLDIKLTDLSEISGYEGDNSWISPEEIQRIDKLEIIDEIEEIRLLLKHYCLTYAGIGDSFKSDRKWIISENY